MSNTTKSPVMPSNIRSQFGCLDVSFLSRSVSTLNPPAALTVHQDMTIRGVILTLKSNKTGCVAVVDAAGKLVGIFSERDVLLKVAEGTVDTGSTPVSAVMTPSPVAEPPDTSIAYALNLMSQGGFRHIPIVDDNHEPIAMLSVKTIVDYLVQGFTDALLSFNEPGTGSSPEPES